MFDRRFAGRALPNHGKENFKSSETHQIVQILIWKSSAVLGTPALRRFRGRLALAQDDSLSVLRFRFRAFDVLYGFLGGFLRSFELFGDLVQTGCSFIVVGGHAQRVCGDRSRLSQNSRGRAKN